MALPVLFDNYIQISDVDRKDLGAYLFGDNAAVFSLDGFGTTTRCWASKKAVKELGRKSPIGL